MEVEVTRSGGLAGLRLTWTVEVENQPDPEEWVLLVERLPWSETPPAPPEPDRYTYRIRCEPHVATLAERQVQGPWRDLVDRVRDVAEPSRGRPGVDGRRTPEPARSRQPADSPGPAESPKSAGPAGPDSAAEDLDGPSATADRRPDA